MITALDAKVLDANSAALGVGVDRLMDRAGAAVAELLQARYHGRRFGIFCGHGNNGGDGFAAALHLAGEQVTVYLFDDPSHIRSPAAAAYFAALKCPARYFGKDLPDCEVLVDAALGTGLTGSLRTPYDQYVAFANAFTGPVVSVDVPTGLGCTQQVRPTVTVTMHDLKEGMNGTNCGEIVVADIGIPPEAAACTGPGDFLRYPVPAPDSHKGANGSLLVIGGGPYFGAPAMAALAALRTGTDLVVIAAPEVCCREIAAVSPVFIIDPLSGDSLCPDHVSRLLELSEEADAVLIGPGLGRDDQTAAAVRQFVNVCRRPLVIDADGLNALGKQFASRLDQTVLTPHAGEYRRLGGTERDPAAVRQLAARLGCTVILKGREDLISDGTRCRRNGTGTPAMTGAGTGDVLAGIIGGLLAKGMTAFDAACLGAYVSGLAGELATERYSYGMIATDVIAEIGTVLRENLPRPEH